MSSSRPSGNGLNSFANLTKESVALPMAETTITRFAFSLSRIAISQTCLIQSELATELPPNLSTVVLSLSTLVSLLKL